jgi:hypothetical protein
VTDEVRSREIGHLRRQEVTLIWFIVWLASDIFGRPAPLRFDPVNWWAGTLLVAVALDLSGHHATAGKRRRG